MTIQEITEFQEWLSKQEDEIIKRFYLSNDTKEKVKLIFNILQADLDLKAEIEAEKEFQYFNGGEK